ncbi:MAG: tetratricopeptide repeat protein [Pirellulales bacterium]
MSTSLPTLAAGLELHRAGQFDQAEQVYRQVAAAEPENADAWNLLGAVCINLNRFEEAEQHLNEALRISGQHHAALDNHGVLLGKQGRYAEAIESFQRALAIQPNQAVTYLNMAEALLRNGQPQEAIAAFGRVLALAPDSLRAHSELAKALNEDRRPDEALPHWQHLVCARPNDPALRFELAAVLAQLGRLEDAKTEYREVLRQKPDSAETCVNLGVACLARNELEEAVGLFRRAIELRGRFAEAYLNLGGALTRQGKPAEAIDVLEQALRLKPDSTEARNNLGIALAAEARFAEAEVCYRQVIDQQLNHVDAIYNLGLALLKQGRIASAIEQFEQAIALKPDYAEAHHNRSAALLLSEDFADGLPEYEWRFRSRDYGGFKSRWPLWQGEPLAGRTIVLVAEQGLGDTFQFIRYAALVKEQAARVIVECPALLHAALHRTPGVDEWIAPETATPEADFCVPLLSLPYRLGTTYETIPANVPYVFADPALVESWRERLGEQRGDSTGFRVGIVWQGNPRFPDDRYRSIPLAALAPLAKLAGVQLVSLQKHAGVEQIAAVAGAWPLVDLSSQLESFADTAAVMQNLDLVISSDTAPAHLAGALGVPVWTALPCVPDWRWMLERDDSPWYPTMRLFRQAAWGEWGDVFERMALEVRKRIDEQ